MLFLAIHFITFMLLRTTSGYMIMRSKMLKIKCTFVFRIFKNFVLNLGNKYIRIVLWGRE